VESSEPQKPSTAEQPRPPSSEHAAAPQSVDPHERIDGLRTWLAQVDRRLGIRTYAFAAASVLALAAAAVAIILALQLQEDSATKGELDRLRSEIGAVEESASEAAADDVRSLGNRLDELEGEVSALRDEQGTTQEELQVVEDDIDDLRSQVSDLESQQSEEGSGGSGSP
jgi:septal ring factor EnvC (AmiA/AmiB activator)